MIGIEAIASYIPPGRLNNLERMAEFDTDELFLREKLGILEVARSASSETAASMCERAFQALTDKSGCPLIEIVEAVIVVTQTPSEKIPHVSAKVHAALNLPDQCACFDISLGCSGYVYGLNIVHSLMTANGFRQALLFTADPYSKIVNPRDKNTALLFGDAATVTLMSDKPTFEIGRGTMNTRGSEGGSLVTHEGILQMNGRAVFNFCATQVPNDIQKVARINTIDLTSVDRILLHQGSRYIVDTIARRLEVDPEKIVFGIEQYGNTVSSSIPLLLEQEIANNEVNTILISGFGVGLSWASNLLTRII